MSLSPGWRRLSFHQRKFKSKGRFKMSKQHRSLDYLLHLLFIQSYRLLREKKARMAFGPQDQKGKPSTRQCTPAINSFQQSPLRHNRASNCQRLSKLRNRLTVENSRDTAAVLARPQVHRSKLKTLHTTSRALDLSWRFTDSTAKSTDTTSNELAFKH